jgi:hypothetical protein
MRQPGPSDPSDPGDQDGEAGIMIKDGRYFSAMWFIAGAGSDWLAALWRDPGGPWHVVWRFRYYVDDRAHDSADERSWSEYELPGTTPEAGLSEAIARTADDLLRAGDGAAVHEIVLRTDKPDVIAAALQREHFMHLGRDRRCGS